VLALGEIVGHQGHLHPARGLHVLQQAVVLALKHRVGLHHLLAGHQHFLLQPSQPDVVAHPRHQLVEVEGLGDEIVGTQVQPDHLLGGFALRGDQDHGQIVAEGIVADRLEQVQPAHHRHHHVGEHQLDLRVLLQQPEGDLPFPRGVHQVVLLLQVEAHHAENVRIVVHDQEHRPLDIVVLRMNSRREGLGHAGTVGRLGKRLRIGM
jgi:hypothetical protein